MPTEDELKNSDNSEDGDEDSLDDLDVEKSMLEDFEQISDDNDDDIITPDIYDEKRVISDILHNLGDFPVPDVEDDEIEFHDVYLYGNGSSMNQTDMQMDVSKYLPQVVQTRAGDKYIQVHENFGYVCSNCDTEVSLKAKSCPNCNVSFAYVKCEKCRYVGERADFNNHVCPQCHAAPVIIEGRKVKTLLCPGCNRPYNKGEFHCKLCGWVDFGALSLLIGLAILIGIGVPLFSLLFHGIAADIMYHVGLFFGGLMFWNFAHTIIRAYDRPRRISFYWFCAIVSASILLVFNFRDALNYHIQIGVIHTFLMIVIVGEIISLLRRKSRFCKGKATVGLIVRRQLYPSTLLEETFETSYGNHKCNFNSMKKTEAIRDFDTRD